MQLARKKTLSFVYLFLLRQTWKEKREKKITSSMWLEYKMDFFKKNVLFIGIGGITNALTPTGPTVLNTKEFSKKKI